MHLSTILLLPALTSAWTLTLGRDVWEGKKNRGCTGTNHAAGERLDWDRGFFESCCIRLYGNNQCKDPQAGISCPDWKKTLSQPVRSFQVTNC